MSISQKLRELKIRPKKKWGQHFSVDPGILGKIVRAAALEPEDVVLEIGAGLGTLTWPLASHVHKIYAVEIDPRLVQVLAEEFQGNDRVEIIQGDALQIDMVRLFYQAKRKLKVVANLPYEISSPMIFRLFRERACFSLFVLMLQMEVARRLVARPGKKDYGPLSLWTQLYTDARIAFPVSPRAFIPRPKVDSAVVKFAVLEAPRIPVDDEKILQQVIRSAFRYRRKTLVNALRMGDFPNLPAGKIQAVLQAVGIEPLARGDILPLEKFCALSRKLATILSEGIGREGEKTP
jgi:16S rRNA (adenine1518-N6/adenine1519-N6)-dimethyltransferase